MELKWLLTSAFTQVFEHSCHKNQKNNSTSISNKKDSVECPKIKIMNKEDYPCGFKVPLHYPKHSRAAYETMEEWKLDLLLMEYGLSLKGTLDEKRAFAIGSFLWPDQL